MDYTFMLGATRFDLTLRSLVPYSPVTTRLGNPCDRRTVEAGNEFLWQHPDRADDGRQETKRQHFSPTGARRVARSGAAGCQTIRHGGAIRHRLLTLPDLLLGAEAFNGIEE
ncbi:peptidase U32 [Anopheles sinensis]|uniref:Peptidase U32 n=1 Tax=Anopheles sinensis TaxID=74873 RepID=A0A084WDI0_ANOSI|nr:peptidase U32 [Anopheles sinensis]